MSKIGDQIKKRRESLFLIQEDVAEMAGITIKTIYHIESNKGNPSLQTVQKILDILGLEIMIGIKNTINEGAGL